MKSLSAIMLMAIAFCLLPFGGSRGTTLTPFATYYGGTAFDICEAVAVDASGNTILVGHTQSADFPVSAGAYQTALSGTIDAFIVKLDPSGQRLWATYFGGSERDWGSGVAIAADGSIIIVGTTRSTDLPTTPGAFQRTIGGGADAFIARFDANGTLVWATYFGGRSDERGPYSVGTEVTIDAAGNILITGATESSNLPVTPGAFQTSKASGKSTADAYISKFTSAGARLWSTYYGGSAEDCGLAISTDTQNNVIFTGTTASSNFPVSAGALQPLNAGWYDAFVVKMNPSGERVWSTYYGGIGYDSFLALTCDATDAVLITGRTASANFPVTPGTFHPNGLQGSNDVAVVKLSSGGALVFSTHFGGGASVVDDGGDYGYGVLIDPSGCIYITGASTSPTLPVLNAMQPTYAGSTDAFIAKFDASFSAMLWSTYWGGSNTENALGIGRDANGNICFAGYTYSLNFPVFAALQPAKAGSSDAFVVWLNSDGQLPGYNAPPIANATATPSQGMAPLNVSFSSSGSYDPDGTIISYAWSFGDGGTSTEANPMHQYWNAGVYSVVLTVTDDDNATATYNATVAVDHYMFVFSMYVWSVRTGSKWRGQAEIVISDDLYGPVSGAMVTASYSGPTAGNVSGMTDASGVVTLQTAAISNPVGSWCFTITDVQAVGYVLNWAMSVLTACDGYNPAKSATHALERPEITVFPNPMHSSTTISYALPADGHVCLRIYDLLGRQVATVTDAPHLAGTYTAEFDAAALPRGMYLCRLEANGIVVTRYIVRTK